MTQESAPLTRSERETRHEERETEAERVRDEQRRAGPHAVLRSGDREDRAEDRTDARRPTEAERDTGDDRSRVAEPSELRLETLLLVQPRRLQEQRAEQEQAHPDEDRAGQAGQQVLVVAQELTGARDAEAEQHEHRAEPEDEQRGRADDPALLRLGAVLQRGEVQAGDHREVARARAGARTARGTR